MIATFQREDTLEEMWRIKRELSTQHGSWAEYAASLMAFQEEERREGVKFYSSRKPRDASDRESHCYAFR